jgi:DNA-directed RNA polymerase subunit RPC12/RpoP
MLGDDKIILYHCHGICDRLDKQGLLLHAANHPKIKDSERYRCGTCQYWLSPENDFILIRNLKGLRCPCCHSLMKRKPRMGIMKEKLKQRIEQNNNIQLIQKETLKK